MLISNNNKINQMYKSLSEALTDLGWYHIDNIEIDNKQAIDLLNEVLDFSNRDTDGSPKILAEQKTVIVCDNHDFNETYLIDMVSEVLKQKETKPGDYQLIYVDNITARQYIDNPKFIQYHNGASVDELKTIEKNQLKPQVIVVNPDVQAIVKVSETEITQITKEMVNYVINYLDNEFAKTEKAK